MPPRSIAPIGIGTPHVEALSSYVMRLARWHSALPGPLVHRLLAHVACNDARFVGRWRRRTGRLLFRGNMNGYTYADAWVVVLAKFTGRADLIDLTTHSFERLFCTRHLLSSIGRVCPFCLEQDAVPFHRLAWVLAPVTACVEHRCRLLDHCPYCRKKLPVLHERSSVSSCPWCARSLVADLTPQNGVPSAAELQFAKEVGGLIQHCTACDQPLIGSRLARVCRIAGIGNATVLARHLGTGKSTTWEWWNTKSTPNLRYCLQIALLAGVPLHRAVARRAPAHAEIGALSCMLPRPVRRPARTLDWARVRSLMEAEIQRPVASARSLAEVSAVIGLSARQLRTRFSTQTKLISSRAREKRLIDQQRKNQALVAEITRACETAIQLGLPARQNVIAELLGRKTFFASPRARRDLGEILSATLKKWPKDVVFPSANIALHGMPREGHSPALQPQQTVGC